MDQAPSFAQHTDPPTRTSGFISRLMGVYFSPGEAFREMDAAPKVVLPIVLLLVMTLGASVFIANRMPLDQMNDQRLQQMVESGRISQDQADQQREAMKKMSPYMKFIIPVSALITIIVMIFGIAGIIKLVSLMIGTENRYMPLVAVVTYSLLAISIVTTIIFLVLIFIKPAEDFDWENPIGSNLSAILGLLGVKLPRFLKTFLGYVDIFFIWRLSLLAIGTAAVSRKLKTSTAMFWATAVALLIALGHAAWSGIFG